jgi:hypothetical protein
MKTSCWLNRNSVNRSPLRHAAFFLVPLLVSSFGLASAATITVTNNNDNGAGSLRQAIAISSPGDTIDFDPSLNGQTITLTSGELLINKYLTITGPGANLLVVNGSLASRVFNIDPGFQVTISGLTISFGRANSGGGILNNGSLTIIDSTLSRNNASLGSGINNTGSLTITSSTISANRGLGLAGEVVVGAGIRNSDVLMITNSDVIGNVATLGGGISNSGSMTITNSTLSGNLAGNLVDGYGGGIDNSGSVTIANSTVSSNGA